MNKAFIGALTVIALLTACKERPTERPRLEPPEPELPPTETANFVFIQVQSSPRSETDIETLNAWIAANPGKRVSSFTGVYQHPEGVSGYILFTEEGDNATQKFARVYRTDTCSCGKPETAIFGIDHLQAWKDLHPNARLIGIVGTPKSQNGVREYTVCYDDGR